MERGKLGKQNLRDKLKQPLVTVKNSQIDGARERESNVPM